MSDGTFWTIWIVTACGLLLLLVGMESCNAGKLSAEAAHRGVETKDIRDGRLDGRRFLVWQAGGEIYVEWAEPGEGDRP